MLHLIHWIVNYHHEAGFAINRPYGNNMYTIMLFRGPLLISQDGNMVYTEKNSCIVYEPFAPQLYYNNEQGYDHDGIFFDGEIPFHMFRELKIPLNTAFPVSNASAISCGIQRVAEEARAHGRYADPIIDLRIRDLIYTLAEGLPGESTGTNDYSPQLFAMRHSILTHPERKWNAKQEAAKMHISVSYLQHLYKEFFGISPGQEIIRSRMACAEFLLRDSKESISSIAEICGYSNCEHFIRQFKKYHAISPSAYRRNCGKGTPG